MAISCAIVRFCTAYQEIATPILAARNFHRQTHHDKQKSLPLWQQWKNPLSRGEGGPEGGRETAPAGACGEQPPKAALSERRNAGGNPAMTEIFRPPAGSDLREGLENGTGF